MVSIGVQSLAMMLISLLSDILVLAITVFLILKFEPSIPFLEATIAAKDMKCASFPKTNNDSLVHRQTTTA